MESLANRIEATAAAGRRGAFAQAAWRDRWLYAMALGSLAVGFALEPFTGTQPDYAIVTELGTPVLFLVAVFGAALLLWKLAWLAIVQRSTSPSRDLLAWMRTFFSAAGVAVNAMHTFAIFVAFAGGFAVMKGAVAVLVPFSWDAALADIDRFIHFGRLPHEWLMPLLGGPAVLKAVNTVYNLWFFVLVASFIVAAGAGRSQRLRHRYLMSFMLVWTLGGFLMAMGYSSAGPCFYERAGFGTLYAPLMEHLHAASAEYTLWALDTQDKLWAGFSGDRPGSAGISAFPSMHVATATLFVLAARHMHRAVLALAVAFWLAIMTGSVLLAWHYAVDGYAGALIAVALWRLTGRYAAALPDSPAYSR